MGQHRGLVSTHYELHKIAAFLWQRPPGEEEVLAPVCSLENSEKLMSSESSYVAQKHPSKVTTKPMPQKGPIFLLR